MRPQKLRFFFVLFVFISVFSFSPKVFASTLVDVDIVTDTTWDLAGSPYIVQNNINVNPGVILTIEPGVIVKFNALARGSNPSTLSVYGKVIAEGTAENKIYFTSLWNDSVGGDTNGDGNATIPDPYTFYGDWSGIRFLSTEGEQSLKNVALSYAIVGLSFDNSTGIIYGLETNFNNTDLSIGNNSSVSISKLKSENSFGSVYNNGANLILDDSIIENSLSTVGGGVNLSNGSHTTIKNAKISHYYKAGIYDAGGNTVSISNTEISNNFFYGIFVANNTSLGSSQYIVNDLTIKDNTRYAAYNQATSYSIDLRNVYWGSPLGPHISTNPNDFGNTISSRILFSPWLLTDPLLPPPPCCSSVLFLPGIKGSVLEKGSDTLWPPTFFSNDISQLALTSGGESVNDVHTDGILNTFYGTPIYAPFSSFMNSLVADGTMKEWLPFAYDWRFLPETILQDGVKTANGTLDVMGKIEEIAIQSKTGKVTIVAHSMGGLLGKAIIKKLQDEGKDNLIDSFVMVATPQLGTPQAVASILHGDDEGIVAGFIVNPIGIRRIAQNMPSAYNLLPSSRYFNEVSDPVITFNSDASFTQTWRNFWGTAINIYSSFLSFVTGTGVARTKPVENILQDPEVLSSSLMTNASNFHSQYDNYQFPSHIRVVQVAGWGSPTTKTVEYKTNHGIPSYGTLFTREGDRAVVYPSAVSSVADETYFFNIFDYNKQLNSNTQHRDLLSSSPIQNLIKSSIKNENITESNLVTSTKPQVVNIADQLVISTHSPVILGAYDQFGNFTGIDPNQNLSADVLSIKEDIPGSTFLYTSESQNIFLPKEGSYNFVYKGTGNGPTTVTIENFSADTATPIASYTDIPTTASTAATFTIQSATPENTAIALDENGDGVTDSTISADSTELSLSELITLIKEKIYTLNVTDKLKQNLLKKISNLEKKIENKKQKNAKILASLQKKISKQEMKGKINTADATGITNLLDTLEAQAEDIALDSGIITDLKVKIQSLNIKQNFKNDLLKRIGMLENKRQLIKTLSSLSKNIMKKAGKGKIADLDAQALIDLLSQIENII